MVQGFIKNAKKEEVRAFNDDLFFGKDEFNNFLYQLHLINNVGFLWCRLFRLELIKKNTISFDERYVVWEDMEFIFRYMTKINSCRIQRAACYHYFEPDYANKYSGKTQTIESLRCLCGTIYNCSSLIGWNNSPVLVSLINSMINCSINICRKRGMQYLDIKDYIIKLRKSVRHTYTEGYISKRSRIFLFISPIGNTYIMKLIFRFI